MHVIELEPIKALWAKVREYRIEANFMLGAVIAKLDVVLFVLRSQPLDINDSVFYLLYEGSRYLIYYYILFEFSFFL